SFGRASTAAMPTSAWVDAGSTYAAANPFMSTPDNQLWVTSPATGMITGAGTITFKYTAMQQYYPTAIQNLMAGNLVPAVVMAYSATIGLQFFMALVIGAIVAAVYIKTENSWMALLILLISGGVFVGLFPYQFGMLGAILLMLGIAGAVWKAFWGKGED
ncbi:MAG: hypothetical protein ACP5RJ_08925, partial [Conexivisphaera sp.]